jgi:DNA-binding MarR family transcriptional regulator
MEIGTIESAPASRKAQAYQYICDYIVARGHSPAMIDIARGLGISKPRAKQLVDQLAIDGTIERLSGAQRAIVVPGLEQRAAIARLRSLGFTVDEDVFRIEPPALPKDNLSLVVIIEHLGEDDESSV